MTLFQHVILYSIVLLPFLYTYYTVCGEEHEHIRTYNDIQDPLQKLDYIHSVLGKSREKRSAVENSIGNYKTCRGRRERDAKTAVQSLDNLINLFIVENKDILYCISSDVPTIKTKNIADRSKADVIEQHLVKKKCMWQTESCISTYNNNCCRGMKCSDVFGGYCMGKPFQKCLCVPMSYGHT